MPAVVNEVIEGDCVYTESIATNFNGEVVYKKHQNVDNLLDGPVGTVEIGISKEPSLYSWKCHANCPRKHFQD